MTMRLAHGNVCSDETLVQYPADIVPGGAAHLTDISGLAAAGFQEIRPALGARRCEQGTMR